MAILPERSGVITDQPRFDIEGRLFCYALDEEHWVVGGPINAGNTVFSWAGDKLFAPEKQLANMMHEESLDVVAKIAKTIPAGSDGLIFHPFLNGDAGPMWNANARGSFFGLTPHHTRAHMARAVLEGTVYELYAISLTLETVVGEPRQIMATGNFARFGLWRQILADGLSKSRGHSARTGQPNLGRRSHGYEESGNDQENRCH